MLDINDLTPALCWTEWTSSWTSHKSRSQPGTCRSEEFTLIKWIERTKLLIYLSIQRKVIKPHGTDEVDVGGLRVHDLFISRDPQTRVLWQHLHNLHTLLDSEDSNNIRHLEGLEVVDEDVGQPELFDQLQVDGNESVSSCLLWRILKMFERLISPHLTRRSSTLPGILPVCGVSALSTSHWNMNWTPPRTPCHWSSARPWCRCLCRSCWLPPVQADRTCCSPGRRRGSCWWPPLCSLCRPGLGLTFCRECPWNVNVLGEGWLVASLVIFLIGTCRSPGAPLPRQIQIVLSYWPTYHSPVSREPTSLHQSERSILREINKWSCQAWCHLEL